MNNWYDNAPKYHVRDQEGMDRWLSDYVDYSNWAEWIPIQSIPMDYRSFSFKDPKHATMFMMKWA